tara:strand:+ start:3257 stop:4360 length:1104 start_codon:yes stop_codon:yes gene_type:complete
MDTFEWCRANNVPITEIKPPLQDQIHFHLWKQNGNELQYQNINIEINTVGSYHICFKDCELLVRGEDRDTIPMVILTPDNKLLASKISKVAGKWVNTPQHFWKQPLSNGIVELQNTDFGTFHTFAKKINAMFTQTQYWHWLVEDLPTFSLIDNDYPIFGQYLNEFEKSTLEYFPQNERYKELDGPSIISSPEINIYTYPNDSMGKVNPWVHKVLRDHMLSPEIEDPFTPKKIYITREDADCRRVTNEPEVMWHLEKYGFTFIRLSDYDFKQKMMLFYNANFIIGPHGAGLVNTLFSKPNTKVLEFMTHHWIGKELGFVRFGNQSNVNWNTLVCEEDLTEKPRLGKPKNADMKVNIEALKTLIEHIEK